MKILGVLITKLHQALGVSLSLVGLLHNQEILNPPFNDQPKPVFMREKFSELFQLIKESNSHIAVKSTMKD
jgi:hypothetical protein